jgi:uncharacterized protein
MTFRLLPRDARFFDLFLADGENLQTAAQRLLDLVTSFDRLEERIAEIRVLEHRGDEIDDELTRRLEEAFVTPFDREDIHELASRLDDIVDGIKRVAESFLVYDVDRPTDEARQLAEIIAAQAGHLLEALRRLDGLKDVGADLEAVHRLESDADSLSRAAVARLFRERQDPLNVIKWRDLYDGFEETIDAAEDAGEVIERMYHKGA